MRMRTICKSTVSKSGLCPESGSSDLGGAPSVHAC
jgi:hypothetical protein